MLIMNKFKKGDMVRHILLQRVGEFIRYGSLTGEECYVNFIDEDGYDDCLCVTTSLLESYEEKENMDMSMNGHTMKDINYAVCVEWGIDSDGKDYCNGTLSKLKPENKEEAYRLLDDMLTIQEMKSITQRLEVAVERERQCAEFAQPRYTGNMRPQCGQYRL